MLQKADHDFGHCPVSSAFFLTQSSGQSMSPQYHTFTNTTSKIGKREVLQYCMQCPRMEMAVQNYYKHQGCIIPGGNDKNILKANYYNAGEDVATNITVRNDSCVLMYWKRLR